ncbi:MAG: DEAD/DEAH box helicase [Methanophagales archaeon]|nr:DEAD/DEAH box helicase [Methanophagales archaeon]
MDKAEFLRSVEERVDYILEDSLFKNNIAQIRAKATLSQITDQQLPIEFKFDKNFVISYARFLLSSINYFSSGAEIDAKVKDKLLNAAHSAAEAYEFLYQLMENKEKERALLNACIAYHIAGYQANAIFLARKLKEHWIPPEDKLYATLYRNLQQNLLYFLERKIQNLIVQTNQTINQLKDLQQDLINMIEERGNAIDIYDFTSQLGLHKALNNFAFYTISGNREFLENSETELKRVNRITSDIGDFELNFLISNLIVGLKLFKERSTWENIRKKGFDGNLDFRWKLYLRNSAFNSIVEFWKSQLIALEKGLITSNSGFVVQMPTSAGKTKVAELAILAELIKKPGFKCIYLAPFRALAYEIEETLSSAFAHIGFHVSSVVGSFESDDFENHLMQTSDVIVTTPEKMDLLFRTQPEFFDKVALVVVDEGHIIEQIERGPKLELLLTRLKRKVAHTGARFLFISAVVPEITAKEFAQWLTGRKESVLSVEWRPTRQLLGWFEWRNERGTIYYPELEIGEGKVAFIPKIIEKQTASLPAKKVTAAKLALAFAKQGPVLVFCGMPQYVEPVAKELLNELNQQEQYAANLLPNYRDDLLSIEVAKEWLGEEHDLIKYLRRGIGVHYGPMPEALRRAIEDEFRSGKLSILVATNTLGQGVNLPIKTVIVHTLNIGSIKYGRYRRPKYLKVRDFWNICGRAGRALYDTEGQIIFITHTSTDKRLFNHYKEMNKIESVKGRLYEILRTLLQRRISEDDIDELFSENLIDTHLLSMLVEESVNTPDEKILRNFLNDSLVKVQALNNGLDMEPLIKASTIVSRRIYTKVEDETLRKIFAKTGLSIKSCEELSEYIQENIARFVDFCEHTADSNKEDIVKLIHGSLIELHEMKEEKKIKYKEGAGDYNLLQSWINLMSIPEMVMEFTQGEEVEKVVEYIDKKFVYKFSWGTNAFTKILAYKMGKDLEDLPLFLKYLPSMIKFGVNTHYACWAMSLGILSRNVAHKIGKAYREERGESEDFNDFIEWFKTLSKEKFGKLGMSELQTKTLERRVTKLTVYNMAEYDKIKREGIIAKIKGLEYGDRLRDFKEVEEGSALYLERDYLNEHDINAIKIYYKDKELGFISSKLARILAPLMDFGERFEVMLESKRDKTIKIIGKGKKAKI